MAYFLKNDGGSGTPYTIYAQTASFTVTTGTPPPTNGYVYPADPTGQTDPAYDMRVTTFNILQNYGQGVQDVLNSANANRSGSVNADVICL